jgi:hypothetical protein
MADYFVVADDATLLPADMRGSDVVSELASAVEADVLRAFTGRDYQAYATDVTVSTAVPRYVYLQGYTADAADCPSDLKAALKATIAEVLAWRVYQSRKNPLLQIQFANGVSTNYTDNANDSFPANWRRRLRDWDVRPAGVSSVI